jgi:predicted Rossmann-fold nucleotide-binding protein
MLDFNSRHDVLFLGSMFHIVCPGRLGTDHELKDLLNRLKHRLLDKAPVYFIERDGYWSNKVDFMTTAVTDDLGPRTSPSDFAHAKIVDLSKTTPEEFVQMVLVDLEKAQTAAFQAV